MSADNYKYGRYIDNNQETRWASVDEIKRSSTHINLSDEHYPVGGLPLLSDGKVAYVDGLDTHTLIFGATGSKKTRLFCMPLTDILANAGESFVVTDPKGEIYQKTSGLVKSRGYKTVVLNFRDIGYGDMWNPLYLPYKLYHSGNEADREKGIAMLNDFVASIADPLKSQTDDVFWPEMASSFALANLLLIMECGTLEQANVVSLANLCGFDQEKYLEELSKLMDTDSLAGMNYRGIFAGATDTRRSVYAVLFGMIRIFNTQRNLAKMLSGNTIDITNIGKEKTAVYLIIPDEKTTYHFLATAFVRQVYQVLISEAQRFPDSKLPVRVNFILDEFCNMPKITDMPAMISAARSRNIRYFLVAQSMHQLKGKYGEDADTIKGNCDNWVFLTSKELMLLQEISDLCGEICLPDNRKRKLISISELQRLSKEKGEALIMHSRQYPIITEIADIDDYEDFRGYPAALQLPYTADDPQVFGAKELLMRVLFKEIHVPFRDPNKSIPESTLTTLLIKYQR